MVEKSEEGTRLEENTEKRSAIFLVSLTSNVMNATFKIFRACLALLAASSQSVPPPLKFLHPPQGHVHATASCQSARALAQARSMHKAISCIRLV